MCVDGVCVDGVCVCVCVHMFSYVLFSSTSIFYLYYAIYI